MMTRFRPTPSGPAAPPGASFRERASRLHVTRGSLHDCVSSCHTLVSGHRAGLVHAHHSRLPGSQPDPAGDGGTLHYRFGSYPSVHFYLVHGTNVLSAQADVSFLPRAYDTRYLSS